MCLLEPRFMLDGIGRAGLSKTKLVQSIEKVFLYLCMRGYISITGLYYVRPIY